MQVAEKPIVIPIEGEIYTNSHGVNKLMQFYSDASQYKDKNIIVDFYELQWFDANLTALLNAITYRLKKENNLHFSADFNFLAKNFSVFFRNGWLQDENYTIEDTQETTIPCTHFLQGQEADFVEYVDKKLMCNQGLVKMTNSLKKRIQSDLLEVFQNMRHARTTDPCFICGQFYPTKKFFVLTLVDLGVGFLPPIQEYTGGEVSTHIGAIRWALSGKSTMILNPSTEMGGLGLEGILQYCTKNNGVFQIYTGSDFWGTDLEDSIWQGCRELKHSFKGSMLNLFFNFKE